MGVLKNATEIRSLKEAGRITREVLDALCDAARPGVSTLGLEILANRLLAKNRSSAPFKTFEGPDGRRFNHAICVSINAEIVNGLPSRDIELKANDLVSIAIAAEFRGLHAKAAATVFLGDANPPDDVARLLRGTAAVIPTVIERSTELLASSQANTIPSSQQADTMRSLPQPGAASSAPMLSEVLAVVPETALAHGLIIIRNMGGAGIGKKLHEWPAIANDPAELPEDVQLTPGLCFTVMPMFSLGNDPEIDIDPADGWTYLTRDRAPSAHFADTLLMTEEGLLNVTASSVAG